MNQILLHKFHQFCCRRRLHFPCGGGDADLKDGEASSGSVTTGPSHELEVVKF